MDGWRAIAWVAIKQWIRLKFPQVRSVSTAGLAIWLSQAEVESPLLLDARTADEYGVSHLKGAQHVPAQELDSFLQENAATQTSPIVVYCSVGYRSARLAQQLQDRGYRQVFNLEGSLFEWVNNGHPVYQGEQPVQQVHPYNQRWGALLRPRWN